MPDSAYALVQGRRLASLFAKANAPAAILALRGGRALGAVDLAQSMGGNKAMGRPMAEHLQAHGIATVTEGRNVFGTTTYTIQLTADGERMADALADIAMWYKDASASPTTGADAAGDMLMQPPRREKPDATRDQHS